MPEPIINQSVIPSFEGLQQGGAVKEGLGDALRQELMALDSKHSPSQGVEKGSPPGQLSATVFGASNNESNVNVNSIQVANLLAQNLQKGELSQSAQSPGLNKAPPPRPKSILPETPNLAQSPGPPPRPAQKLPDSSNIAQSPGPPPRPAQKLPDSSNIAQSPSTSPSNLAQSPGTTPPPRPAQKLPDSSNSAQSPGTSPSNIAQSPSTIPPPRPAQKLPDSSNIAQSPAATAPPQRPKTKPPEYSGTPSLNSAPLPGLSPPPRPNKPLPPQSSTVIGTPSAVLQKDAPSADKVSSSPINKKTTVDDALKYELKGLLLSNGENWKITSEKLKDVVFDHKTMLDLIDEIFNKDDPLLSKLRMTALKNYTKFKALEVGHEFGLGGEIKVNNANSKQFTIKVLKKVGLVSEAKTSLEGMGVTAAHAKIAYSVNDTAISMNSPSSIANLNISPHINGSEILKEAAEIMATSASYGQYDTSQEDSPELQQAIKNILNDLQQGKPVTIATGWPEHAVEITIYKNIICYSNRGQRSDDQDANMKFYTMKNPKIDEQFIRNLLVSETSNPAEAEEMTQKRMQYFEKGMLQELGCGGPFNGFWKKDQKVGNCTFAQAKCGLHAVLLFLLVDKAPLPSSITGDPKLFPDFVLSEKINAQHDNATKLFKFWEAMNRQKGVDHLVDFLKDIRKENILSEKDEFKLMANVLNKICKPGSTYSSEDLKNEVDEFMNGRSFKISNCMVNLKGIDDNTDEFVNCILNNKPPGAFILLRDEKGFKIAYNNPKQQYLELSARKKIDGKIVYSCVVDGKKLHFSTVQELMKAIPNCKFPLMNDALLEEREALSGHKKK